MRIRFCLFNKLLYLHAFIVIITFTRIYASSSQTLSKVNCLEFGFVDLLLVPAPPVLVLLPLATDLIFADVLDVARVGGDEAESSPFLSSLGLELNEAGNKLPQLLCGFIFAFFT